jgi:hypothetical protein
MFNELSLDFNSKFNGVIIYRVFGNSVGAGLLPEGVHAGIPMCEKSPAEAPVAMASNKH